MPNQIKKISPIDLIEETSMQTKRDMECIFYYICRTIVLEVEGDLVELGCHAGKTSALIAATMRMTGTRKKFHVYDSFEGFPPESEFSGMMNCWLKGFKHTFMSVGIPLPVIHKGWFKDTLREGLPEKISFAFIDCDLYESVLICLSQVFPRLTDGAILLIDDVEHEQWGPQVKQAIKKYFGSRHEQLIQRSHHDGCSLYVYEHSLNKKRRASC